MAIRCRLVVAAVMLAVSTSGVWACDDAHEEMALAAAREAVKAARIAAQQQPAERAGQAEATSVASAQLQSAHPQVAAEPTSPLAR